MDIVNDTEMGANENEFLFSFSVQLLDTVALEDEFKFNLSAVITTGGATIATGTDDIEITVVSPSTDNAVLIWNATIVEQPAEVLFE